MFQLEGGGAAAEKNIIKTFLIILILPILSLAVIFWRQLRNFIYTYWWKPRSIRKIMERQGIRGPPPHFITGNLGDMTKLRELKAAKDMDRISHDIVDRLLPHFVQWTNDYGKSLEGFMQVEAVEVDFQQATLKQNDYSENAEQKNTFIGVKFLAVLVKLFLMY